jgi:hypothetical protein
MKTRLVCVLAVCTAASFSAQAATQGTLGPTSTGSYLLTATGPAIPRQVQVLNVSDVSLTNGTRADTDPSTPGVTMRFCLIDTYSGTVQLQLSSSNGIFNPNGWRLQSSGGDLLSYGVSVTSAADGSLLGSLPALSSSFTATVPPAVVVANSGACGVGNVKVNTVLISPSTMPETLPARVYTDTITIVATPQ